MPNKKVANNHQETPIVPEAKTEEPFVAAPSPSEPIKAAMKAHPASVPAGTTVELSVVIRIAKAHYLHAKEDPDGKFAALKIDVPLPAGVTAAKDWEFPPAQMEQTGASVYRDSVQLKRTLNIAPDFLPQTLILAGSLRYQVCTDELCWPLSTLNLSTPLLIQSKPR